MAFLKNLKEKLHKKKVASVLKNQKRSSLHSYSKVKNVGILINENEASARKLALALKKYFQEEGKTVKLLAYSHSDVVSTDIPYPCFCKKDLTFSFSPKKHEDALHFSKSSVDILISLHFDRVLPLEQLTVLNNAPLKIGPYNEDQSALYDLMFYDTPNSLEQFVTVMKQYFKTINK